MSYNSFDKKFEVWGKYDNKSKKSFSESKVIYEKLSKEIIRIKEIEKKESTNRINNA